MTGKEGSDLLLMAVEGGNTRAAARLLRSGAHPRKRDHLLHRAVLQDNEDLARLLLDQQLDPDDRNSKGERPLHLARSLGMARLLVERGASVGLIGRERKTPREK
ncbi:MAG: ankyrin repeat domain-containing protein, partial [Succinivibrionaceae bacterium]|nr:ankyrin repeat domain-containing protein [Succinivibrionaceae bacterium]